MNFIINAISFAITYGESPILVPLLLVLSNSVQSIVLTLIGLIWFIIKSTFVTTYSIKMSEGDRMKRIGMMSLNMSRSYEGTDVMMNELTNELTEVWFKHYLTTKFKEGEVVTLTTTVECTSTSKEMWYDVNGDHTYMQVRQVPTMDIVVFTFQGRPILCYYGMLMTLCTPWNRSTIWIQLMRHVKEKYKEQLSNRQMVYKNIRDQFVPTPNFVNVKTTEDKNYQLSDDMYTVINDISHFMKLETKREYDQSSMSYNYKALIYGIPGTGKTELAYRIAGDYSLPLYSIDCENVSDGGLQNMFDSVQRGVILIDEIDKCIHDLLDKEERKQKTLPSLKAWHKVLDSLTDSEIIVIMTTNNIEMLRNLNHGSFIRSMRVNRVIEFRPSTFEFILEFLMTHFSVDDIPILKSDIYLDSTNRSFIVPADIINAIRTTRNDLEMTVRNIVSLSKSRTRHLERMDKKRNNEL